MELGEAEAPLFLARPSSSVATQQGHRRHPRSCDRYPAHRTQPAPRPASRSVLANALQHPFPRPAHPTNRKGIPAAQLSSAPPRSTHTHRARGTRAAGARSGPGARGASARRGARSDNRCCRRWAQRKLQGSTVLERHEGLALAVLKTMLHTEERCPIGDVGAAAWRQELLAAGCSRRTLSPRAGSSPWMKHRGPLTPPPGAAPGRAVRTAVPALQPLQLRCLRPDIGRAAASPSRPLET